MTTAHCSAVTGSAYEAMMIACTWIGVHGDGGCEDKGGEEGKEDGDHVFTVFTRCRPPVPFLARTTLSLLEMYMYLGRNTSKKPAIFLQGVPKKCLIELLRKRV